jgi:hypothetical protein
MNCQFCTKLSACTVRVTALFPLEKIQLCKFCTQDPAGPGQPYRHLDTPICYICGRDLGIHYIQESPEGPTSCHRCHIYAWEQL